MNFRPKPPSGGSVLGLSEARDDLDAEVRVALRRRLDAARTARERRHFEEMLRDLDQREEGPFMRIYDRRRVEIREALEALPRVPGKAYVSLPVLMMVLEEAAFSMPMDSQRMGVSQARLAEALKLQPETVSRAFAALSHPLVAAVLNRQPEGASVTWEIDAAYASKQGDRQRLAALAAQDEWHAARERLVRAKRAAKVPLREVPFEVVPGGLIDDERQAPLLSE